MPTGLLGSYKEEAIKEIPLRAAAARVAGDVVRVGVGHVDGAHVDISIADNTDVYRVAVALESAASGDIYRAAVEGTVKATVSSDTYTRGHGLHILNGTVLNSDAVAEAPTGASTLNDFALVLEDGAAGTTSIKCNLRGDAITAQT